MKIREIIKLSNYQFFRVKFLEQAEASKNLDNQIINRGTEESYAKLRVTDQSRGKENRLEKYLSEDCLS